MNILDNQSVMLDCEKLNTRNLKDLKRFIKKTTKEYFQINEIFFNF